MQIRVSVDRVDGTSSDWGPQRKANFHETLRKVKYENTNTDTIKHQTVSLDIIEIQRAV